MKVNKCADCGKVTKFGMLDPEGSFLCEECFDDACIICDRCGETIWIRKAIVIAGDTYLCEICWEKYRDT